MKASLLLLLLLAFAPAVLGQQPFKSAPRADLDSVQKLLRERLASKHHTMPNAWGRNTPYSHGQKIYGLDSLTGKPLTLLPPRAAGVYNLPIDGMPCVVPAVDSALLMPNAWAHPSVPYRSSQNIPNPMDRMPPGLSKR